MHSHLIEVDPAASHKKTEKKRVSMAEKYLVEFKRKKIKEQ